MGKIPRTSIAAFAESRVMSVAKKVAQTRWNYDAYCAIPDDGQRHEIIDGEHFVNPVPNLYHQKVPGHLYFQLFSLIEMSGLGSVLYSPTDLQLSDHDVVQPDLVVITRKRASIMTPTRLPGVPEYWIVKPDLHQILQLDLENGHYEGTLETTSITMQAEPRVTVNLNRVW